ncbi:MAG TPA: MBL fold metallo-hydrolase [Mycobacteriales bacterium]|nr:MBL fold metallo-hydrolase [Mycobacteriales bacterium]
MLIEGFPARQLDTNCWVVAPDDGRQSVVIDPGAGVLDRLQAVLDAHGLRPAAVLLTHGHLDHTFSVEPICRTYGIPAYVHPADRHQLADPWSGFGAPAGMPLFGQTTFAEPAEVRELADGQRLAVAGLEFIVAGSPGHTPGSVLLELSTPDGPVCFSGDTLFAGSIGRMDLPGGSEPTMQRTLAEVVLPLADETVVHPGHGPSSTIGAERTTNPYLLQMLRTAR